MKFWQKAFITILVVFIASINTCLYLTSKYSFSLNMERDMGRATSEYHFITKSVNETLNSLYYREQNEPTSSSIESLMRSYADYYKKENVFLELNHAKQRLFTNIPDLVTSGINDEGLAKEANQTEVLSSNGKYYLAITGRVGGQYEDYTLTYVRDLSELFQTHARLNRYLITVTAAVETVLALVLLLLLRKLTHPIRIMQKATNKISGGIYNERVSLPGKDEFHELAENFNQMAISIQEKINELDKNVQDKQRLVDNLAHELRTPLTAIRGYAEYLQNANTSEQNRIKAAGYIMSETDRMKNLAFKLLDLALVKNSKLDLQRMNPRELFDQVQSGMQTKLRSKGIKLEISSSLEELTGDSILLQSMLVNLVDNALKASARDSIIELRAYCERFPILEVRDYGWGMDEEQTALVCEPFYRVDPARSRSAGGIGLGLSLCREIAHLHGAELRINSSSGIGTTVQVIFTTHLQPPENLVMHKEV
ncbi:sensor histidine kinase [Desulfosporosinus youngiae]|uniref:histidine kinase n=1 Tax=Desulfosporosinus youngiae DSM 17734 TaxID=768710 RepID=H5XXE1_9FIRM|nr:ATP-binding protein [Desulfosporosinus youngiae]EHQ91147.1 signal transduction histidine kinase [Desulfosporosinus youngiae DSM 17734]